MNDEEDVERMTKFLELIKQEEIDNEYDYGNFIGGDDDDDDVDDIYNNEDISEDEYDDPKPGTDFIDLCKKDPIAALNEEEKQVINNCRNGDLKRLLILNRTRNLHLISLHKKVKDLLTECQENIQNRNNVVGDSSTVFRKVKAMMTGIWKVGSPYFKDSHMYRAPVNEDVIRKKKNKELLVYVFNSTLKWKPIECERLVGFVKVDYNLNKQKLLIEKKAKMLAGTESEQQKNNQIAVLENRLKELKRKDPNEFPPRFSDEFINWGDIANMFVKENHTDLECRSMWNMFLHPDINKGRWSSKEINKMIVLAKKFNYQNWDLIAEKLGTSRTSLQLCSKFYRQLYDQNKKGEFSHEEDMKLLHLIAKFHIGDYIPWTKITNFFGGARSRSQLYHRYTYHLNQSRQLPGKFTLVEDVMLMICVDKFGRMYRKCQQYLPKRTISQCKSRYTTHCFGDTRKGAFTIEEDEIILKHVEKFGSGCWSKLSKSMKRNAMQLRQRHKTIRNFLCTNPGASVHNMIRKKNPPPEPNAGSYHIARKVADHFKDHVEMPSLEDIQKILQTQFKNMIPASSETESDEGEDEITPANEEEPDINIRNIDSFLVDFFNNSYKIKENANVSKINIKKAIYDVEKCLEVLQADLELPGNLKTDIRLDRLDEEILQHLGVRNSGTHRHYLSTMEKTTNICQSIPPNTYTALGMRSLLIKYLDIGKGKKIKASQMPVKDSEDQEVIRNKLREQLSNLDPLSKDLVESDRFLFFHRFQSLFKNAAVLTLDGPTAEVESLSLDIEREARRPDVKRTFSRMHKNNPADFDGNKQKRLCNISEVSNISVTPLQPVKGESIIEELIKNKDRKLYCLDTITEGGKIMTVAKEVKLSLDLLQRHTTRNSSLSSEGNSIIEIEDSEDTSIVNDNTGEAADLLKLANFLKEENLRKTDSSKITKMTNESNKSLERDKKLAIMSSNLQSSGNAAIEIDSNSSDAFDVLKLDNFLKEAKHEDTKDDIEDLTEQ